MMKQIKKTMTFAAVISLSFVLSVFNVYAEPVNRSVRIDGQEKTGQILEDGTTDSQQPEEETENPEEELDEADEEKPSEKNSDTSKLSDSKESDSASDTQAPASETGNGNASADINTVSDSSAQNTGTDTAAVQPANADNTQNVSENSDESAKTVDAVNEIIEDTESELNDTAPENDADKAVTDIENQTETEAVNQAEPETENQITALKTAGNNTLEAAEPEASTANEVPSSDAAKVVTTAAPAETSAASTDKDRIEGVAYIPTSGNMSGTDTPVRYVYSDKYFEKSSIIADSDVNFNYDLAALSAILANCSGYSSRVKTENGQPNPEAAENQSKNIQTILREIGFENIEINDDYTEDGNPFTTGVLCATKKINVNGKEYTVLGIFPRSFGYTMEWANNGVIGAEGDAQGPSEQTQKKILDFVKNYVKEKGVTGDLKIWSTGVSRGGGLSMLTSAYIDNELGNNGTTESLFNVDGLKLTQDDVYTYTFGAPNWGFEGNTRESSGDKKTVYNNIHNFAANYDILYKLFSGNWGLEHYGYDRTLSTQEALANMKLMKDQYSALLEMTVDELNKTGFFVQDDDGSYVYKPFSSANTYKYQGKTMNLEEFLTAYMSEVTKEVNRESEYAVNQNGVQALLTVFLGQRDKIQPFMDNIQSVAIEELTKDFQEALKILNEQGVEAAIKYIREKGQLDNLSAQIITATYDKVNIKYEYDYENKQEVEKQVAKEIYSQYVRQLWNIAWNLGTADIQGTVNMYRAAGNLWSAHDVNIYASWVRGFSSDSDFYLNNPLTPAEKWGYRMVYLPKEDSGFVIKVYKAGKDQVTVDGVVGGKLDGTINPDGYLREDGFDPYVHIGVDLKGNKVLYLRSDQEYVLEFAPQEDNVNAEGLKIDEFNYEKYYEIFKPVHTIAEDDNKIELEQIARLINDGTYKLSDKLYLEIGGIKFEVDKKEVLKAARMLKSAPAAETVSTHEAEYYLLAKLVELVGAVENETGGKVNSRDYYQTKMLINDPAGVSVTLKASPLDGYRFVGWYTHNGTFVSNSLNFTKYFNFNDSSVLYYARFERIQDEEDDSKPEPAYIPTDGWDQINIPVEVTSLAPARAYRVPKTADKSRMDLWIMFFASLTTAGASMYLLKETE